MREKYQRYLDMVKDELIDISEPGGGKGYRYFHTLRTFHYCKKILELEEVDEDKVDEEALLTAAIFHDVGYTGGEEGENPEEEICSEMHGKKSGEYIWKNLEEIDEEKRRKIASIAGGHHRENPEHYETMILQDADNLDEMGCITVWRYFTYSGIKRDTPEEAFEYWVNEGKEQLEDLLEEFNFESTKEIALKRISTVEEFMDQFQRERRGEDIKDS